MAGHSPVAVALAVMRGVQDVETGDTRYVMLRAYDEGPRVFVEFLGLPRGVWAQVLDNTAHYAGHVVCVAEGLDGDVVVVAGREAGIAFEDGALRRIVLGS